MSQTVGLSAYDNLTGFGFITHLLAITVTSFKSSVCWGLITCRGQKKHFQMNQISAFYINLTKALFTPAITREWFDLTVYSCIKTRPLVILRKDLWYSITHASMLVQVKKKLKEVKK